MAIFMSNPFFNYYIVYADEVMQEFTGSESCDRDSDFNSVRSQNAWKIYSVLRSYGMDKNQACGVLGNVRWESDFRNDCVERDESSTMQSYLNVDGPGEAFCKAYMANTTGYCNKVASTGYDYRSGWKAENGEYYCGEGLCQWTADRGYNLINFASSNRADWWNTEVQLTFLLMNDWEKKLVDTYKTNTDGKDVEFCAKEWMKVFEICDMSRGDPGATRANSAKDYLSKFPDSWDKTYGDRIVSGAGLKPAHRRDSIYDKSIVHEFAAPAIVYPWNSGILTSDKSADMEERNQEVWKGYTDSLNGGSDTSQTYSLFELYGEDIHWYRYLGESTVAPGLADHIYSGVTQNHVDQLTGDIVGTLTYQPSDYLSTHVYDTRPRTLTSYEVNQGYTDPRVRTEIWARFTGYFYVSGSFSLTLAKYIQSLISLLLGNELLVDAANVLTAIETSDEWQTFAPVINVVMVFAVLALIVSLVKNSIKYARGVGGAPPYAVITRFCIAIICMGLIWASFYNPDKFNNVIVKGLGGVDDLFNASLAKALEDDEVIAVKDKSMSTRAAIWKTCIFEPWCRGQFGKNYEELYTNYAKLPSDKCSRMAQSNQTADDVESSTEPYYNSTQATGDVFVPVGGGKKIRNWAAFLYSCGSKYHIDASITSADQVENPGNAAEFPNAKTTAYDSNVYADTFRIIDAQMNISPEYYADKEVIYNYTDSRYLENHFVIEGAIVMINALLLLFFVPAIYQKIKNFIIIIVTCLQCIYYSFIELFKENTGLINLGANLKKAISGYFIADIKIYIMVILYMNFVDKGFVFMIIYCVLCITVLSLTLNDVMTFASNTKERITRTVEKSRSVKRLNQERAAKISQKKQELSNIMSKKSSKPKK